MARSKHQAVECFKPLENKPLCSKAEFARRAEHARKRRAESKAKPTHTVTSSTAACTSSHEQTATSPAQPTPLLETSVSPCEPTRTASPVQAIVDEVKALSLTTEPKLVSASPSAPALDLPPAVSPPIDLPPTVSPPTDLPSTVSLPTDQGQSDLPANASSTVQSDDIAPRASASTLEQDLALSDDEEGEILDAEPCVKEVRKPKAKLKSRLPRDLLEEAKKYKRVLSDQSHPSKSAVKRKAEANHAEGLKKPLVLPSIAPVPKQPVCGTWARFNPGLAHPRPAEVAQNVTVINHHHYYGAYKPPVVNHPVAAQPLSLEQMTRGQKRRYYKRLAKEGKQ